MSKEQKLQRGGDQGRTLDWGGKFDQGSQPVQQAQQTQGCELNRGDQQDQQL